MVSEPLTREDARLAEIVRRLVETLQPERVYLFGSRARGEAGLVQPQLYVLTTHP